MGFRPVPSKHWYFYVCQCRRSRCYAHKPTLTELRLLNRLINEVLHRLSPPPSPHTHPPTSAYTCINRFTSSHCEWVGEWIYILICPYGYAIVSSELYQFEVYIHTCRVIYTHSYTQHTRIRFESFDWMNLCKYVRVCVCVTFKYPSYTHYWTGKIFRSMTDRAFCIGLSLKTGKGLHSHFGLLLFII